MTYDLAKKNYSSIFENLKKAISQGMIVKNYCTTVEIQPLFDFSTVEELHYLETSINNSLNEAKEHVQNYKSDVHPEFLSLLSELNDFTIKIKSAPEVLPEGMTAEQWSEVLNTLRKEAIGHEEQVNNLINKLELVTNHFNKDSTSFGSLALTFSKKLNEDNGELSKIKSEIAGIDKEIAETSTAVAFEALGVAGGIFIIVIGTLENFITAGTSPELVITGVVMIATGVGSLTTTGLALSQSLEKKKSLLAQEMNLSNESKLLTEVDSSLQNLYNQSKKAVEALQDIGQSWNSIQKYMDSLITDLKSGTITVEDVRTAFVKLAKEDATAVEQGIATIKDQLSGTITKELSDNEDITNYVKIILRNNVA